MLELRAFHPSTYKTTSFTLFQITFAFLQFTFDNYIFIISIRLISRTFRIQLSQCSALLVYEKSVSTTSNNGNVASLTPPKVWHRACNLLSSHLASHSDSNTSRFCEGYCSDARQHTPSLHFCTLFTSSRFSFSSRKIALSLLLSLFSLYIIAFLSILFSPPPRRWGGLVYGILSKIRPMLGFSVVFSRSSLLRMTPVSHLYATFHLSASLLQTRISCTFKLR